MITVPVDLGERRYDVLVGTGARRELAAVLPPGARLAAVVTDAMVEEAGWVHEIDPAIPTQVFVVEPGEGAKSMATVETLCRGFARAGLTRHDVVVALGGGIVSDLAGFAAACYHRGTAYVNVATTLLAQVDAAIGGKTGVNLPEGKNLAGAFWQPRGVLCDTDMLATLPAREWACGRGEMAKYAFLGPGEPDGSILALPVDEQVARCARIKAEVVAADEREGGRRALLNYGHTLAHALEAAAMAPTPGGQADRWDLRHGEAVAVGLVFAALLARRLGRIDAARVGTHRQVVEGFGLSAALPPGAAADELVAFMARDKKGAHDLTFVLDGPEGVEVVRDVRPEEVVATLVEMGARPGSSGAGWSQGAPDRSGHLGAPKEVGP